MPKLKTKRTRQRGPTRQISDSDVVELRRLLPYV